VSPSVDLSTAGDYNSANVVQSEQGVQMADRGSSFATRLQRQREAAGLSQYALAKRSGLSKQALSNLEMGRREPSWDTVQRLAVALGVSCEVFTDPSITPADDAPARGRGRPRKQAAPPATPPREEPQAEASAVRRKRKGK
jgi:transcriptional regulator with XRE-family HTH domain